MKTREKQLIEYLKTREGYISADELSAYMDVSTRQIRYYIASINLNYQGLIRTGSKGYCLSDEHYRQYQNELTVLSGDDLETENKILLKIIERPQGITIEELSNTLYLSCSTIENYINRLRKTLLPYQLKLLRRRETLTISGSEQKIRLLIRNMIQIKMSHQSFFTDIKTILNLSIDLELLRDEVIRIIAKHNLFINDHALSNVILHLMIAIERRHRTIYNEETAANISHDIRAAAADIYRFLKDEMFIDPGPNTSELEIALSCYTNQHNYSAIDYSNINEYVDDEIILFSHDLICKINQTFFLTIDAKEFLPGFSLHIQNLFGRINLGVKARNTDTRYIKNNYPLIYNIAVYAAQNLMDAFHISLTEDEISYLSFHIGAHLDICTKTADKMKCTFVYADYYNYHLKMVHMITKELGDSLMVTNIIPVSSFRPDQVQADLIISTIPLNNLTDAQLIEIGPFPKDNYIRQIRKKIEEIKLNRHRLFLYKLIQHFFKPSLFFSSLALSNETEAIGFLAQKAYEAGFVDETFQDQVLQREQLSSTAFIPYVAIPHCLTLSANESFLSVSLSKNPVNWSGDPVKMILLLGISSTDVKNFRIIFDGIIEALTDPKHISKLLNCSDYDSFIDEFHCIL